jgi:hypothetical protein
VFVHEKWGREAIETERQRKTETNGQTMATRAQVAKLSENPADARVINNAREGSDGFK